MYCYLCGVSVFNHFQIQRFAFVLGGKGIINVVINPFITGFTMDISVFSPSSIKDIWCLEVDHLLSVWHAAISRLPAPRHPSLVLGRWFRLRGFALTVALGDVFIWPGSFIPAICSQRVCTDWGGGRRTYMCKHIQQQRWHEADCSGLWHFFGSTHVEEFGSGKEMVTGWFSFLFLLQTTATYSRCSSLYFGVAVLYVQPAFCFVYTAFLLQESIWWGPDRCICLWAAGQ